MTHDITDSIAENIGRQTGALVAANIASTAVVSRGLAELQGNMNAGFRSLASGMTAGFSGLSGQIDDLNWTMARGMSDIGAGIGDVSRQIGEMGAYMDMGFLRIDTAVRESAKTICEKLDSISDTLKNPSLTQARELYARAVTNYNKGFYEEALEEIQQCLKIIKVDYIGWFLQGKIRLFGLGEFSNVIDLDGAVDALAQAAKYITPDAREFAEAKRLASEISFHLAIAKQIKAVELLRGGNRDGAQKLLTEAEQEFRKAFDLSDAMPEALYNAARCHALMGNAGGAVNQLETLIRKNPSYLLKSALDSDFDPIQGEFRQLIEKLRSELYANIQKLWQYRPTAAEELPEILRPYSDGGVPEDTPYLDMLEIRNCLSDIKKRLQSTFQVTDGILKSYKGAGGDVTIPGNLDITTIGEEAFSQPHWAKHKGPTGLTGVVIPDGVTSIERAAFSNNSLTSAVIPDSVTSIGIAAFVNNNLTSVVIPDSVTSIGQSAFLDNPLVSITIPANVKFDIYSDRPSPVFSESFDDYYNSNGKKAGVYHRAGEHCWGWGTNDGEALKDALKNFDQAAKQMRIEEAEKRRLAQERQQREAEEQGRQQEAEYKARWRSKTALKLCSAIIGGLVGAIIGLVVCGIAGATPSGNVFNMPLSIMDSYSIVNVFNMVLTPVLIIGGGICGVIIGNRIGSGHGIIGFIIGAVAGGIATGIFIGIGRLMGWGTDILGAIGEWGHIFALAGGGIGLITGIIRGFYMAGYMSKGSMDQYLADSRVFITVLALLWGAIVVGCFVAGRFVNNANADAAPKTELTSELIERLCDRNGQVIKGGAAVNVQAKGQPARMYRVAYADDWTVISIERTNGSHKEIQLAESGSPAAYYVEDLESGRKFGIRGIRKFDDVKTGAGADLIFDAIGTRRFNMIEGNAGSDGWHFYDVTVPE
jgi:tetratricopeptide (TPR) repeat protein/F0F1-type ATP synthase assembly protein I